jgi:hypothetical protein
MYHVAYESVVFSAVPEPGTCALTGLGMAAFGAIHRRRRHLGGAPSAL